MRARTHFIVWTTSIVLAVLIAGPAAAQTPTRIGVFDPQRVSEETAEGKRIQTELEGMRTQRQSEIQAQEAEVSRLQQTLEQQSLSLSPERRSAMEIDIQRKMLELNSRRDVVSRGFQLEIAAAEAGFNDKLRQVVAQFGRQEGFSLILESGTVAWSSATVDVTTAIIDAFDRAYPAQTP